MGIPVRFVQAAASHGLDTGASHMRDINRGHQGAKNSHPETTSKLISHAFYRPGHARTVFRHMGHHQRTGGGQAEAYSHSAQGQDRNLSQCPCLAQAKISPDA